MTNEKEAPEWWRKFITLATGGTYSYVRTEYIPSIVAEAERRGEIKALEWLRDNASGGGDWRMKIEIKLASLKNL